jgi:hypothetical protein
MTDPAIDAAAAAIIACPDLVARIARIPTGDGTQPVPTSKNRGPASAPPPVVVTVEQEQTR